MKKPIITMLGTGSALVSRCFNTCFVLQSLDGTRLLVDTGGAMAYLLSYDWLASIVVTSATSSLPMPIPTISSVLFGSYE